MKPKILFIYTINPGVAYYRMYMFAQKMSELGVADTRFFPHWDPDRYLSPDWESNLNENWAVIEDSVNWADAVVVQYISSPEGLSLVEAIRDLKPCIMEIDDMCSAVPYYSRAFEFNKPGDRQDYWAIRQAISSTGVITTTDFLKEYFSKWNKNIFIIPNCLDFNLWDSLKSHSNDRIKIGWVGGASHEGDLNLIKDPIYEILNKHKNIEVNIICPQEFNWPPHERLIFSQHWVNIENYPKYLKSLSFDIGLAPLRDNYFNRGKSNLRFLEYSACRIPTIASEVGPFKKNFTGILCSTDEDWFNAMDYLIQNENERIKMGWNSYYFVKDNFNVVNISFDYANLIKEFIKCRGQTLVYRGQEQYLTD